MTKAPYIAKEYMLENGTLSESDINKIIENYEILNRIGIPMTNFELLVKVIIWVIIYCIIALIFA